jgi:hypothetical protein
MTDDRRQLHNQTHLWKRERARRMLKSSAHGHIRSGERAKLVQAASKPVIQIPRQRTASNLPAAA